MDMVDKTKFMKQVKTLPVTKSMSFNRNINQLERNFGIKSVSNN